MSVDIRGGSAELCEERLQKILGEPDYGFCPACQIPVEVRRATHIKQKPQESPQLPFAPFRLI